MIEAIWSEDAARRVLEGRDLPDIVLPCTHAEPVSLASLRGPTVLVWHPPLDLRHVELEAVMAAPSTRQLRRYAAEFPRLRAFGAHVFGVSTQNSTEQRFLARRLALPFPLLSDVLLRATVELGVPLRTPRVTMITMRARILRVFVPSVSDGRDAGAVHAWLESLMPPAILPTPEPDDAAPQA